MSTIIILYVSLILMFSVMHRLEVESNSSKVGLVLDTTNDFTEPSIEISPVLSPCDNSERNDQSLPLHASDFDNNSEEEELKCNFKLSIKIKIKNIGKTPCKEEFILLNYVHDQLSERKLRLLYPIAIKLKQHQILQMYKLKFMRDFCCSCDAQISAKKQLHESGPKSNKPEYTSRDIAKEEYLEVNDFNEKCNKSKKGTNVKRNTRTKDKTHSSQKFPNDNITKQYKRRNKRCIHELIFAPDKAMHFSNKIDSFEKDTGSYRKAITNNFKRVKRRKTERVLSSKQRERQIKTYSSGHEYSNTISGTENSNEYHEIKSGLIEKERNHSSKLSQRLVKQVSNVPKYTQNAAINCTLNQMEHEVSASLEPTIENYTENIKIGVPRDDRAEFSEKGYEMSDLFMGKRIFDSVLAPLQGKHKKPVHKKKRRKMWRELPYRYKKVPNRFQEKSESDDRMERLLNVILKSNSETFSQPETSSIKDTYINYADVYKIIDMAQQIKATLNVLHTTQGYQTSEAMLNSTKEYNNTIRTEVPVESADSIPTTAEWNLRTTDSKVSNATLTPGLLTLKPTDDMKHVSSQEVEGTKLTTEISNIFYNKLIAHLPVSTCTNHHEIQASVSQRSSTTANIPTVPEVSKRSFSYAQKNNESYEKLRRTTEMYSTVTSINKNNCDLIESKIMTTASHSGSENTAGYNGTKQNNTTFSNFPITRLPNSATTLFNHITPIMLPKSTTTKCTDRIPTTRLTKGTTAKFVNYVTTAKWKSPTKRNTHMPGIVTVKANNHTKKNSKLTTNISNTFYNTASMSAKQEIINPFLFPYINNAFTVMPNFPEVSRRTFHSYKKNKIRPLKNSPKMTQNERIRILPVTIVAKDRIDPFQSARYHSYAGKYKHDKKLKHQPKYMNKLKYKPKYKNTLRHQLKYKNTLKHEAKYKNNLGYQPKYIYKLKYEPKYKNTLRHQLKYNNTFNKEWELPFSANNGYHSSVNNSLTHPINSSSVKPNVEESIPMKLTTLVKNIMDNYSKIYPHLIANNLDTVSVTRNIPPGTKENAKRQNTASNNSSENVIYFNPKDVEQMSSINEMDIEQLNADQFLWMPQIAEDEPQYGEDGFKSLSDISSQTGKQITVQEINKSIEHNIQVLHTTENNSFRDSFQKQALNKFQNETISVNSGVKNIDQVMLNEFQIRGQQNCKNTTTTTPWYADSESYHKSTHFVRFSKVWYNVYSLSEPTLEHSLHIQIFEKHRVRNETENWEDLTGGNIINVSSSQRHVRNELGTLFVTYKPSTRRNADSFSLIHDKKRLLIPQCGGGLGEYLVVEDRDIRHDGKQCDKVGAGFEAFTKQANRNQPDDLWQHDTFAGAFGKASVSWKTVSSGGEEKMLALEYLGQHTAIVEVNLKADDISVGSLAQISSIIADSMYENTTKIFVMVTNLDLVSSLFIVRIPQCTSWTDEESRPTRIPPQLSHHFFLKLPRMADIEDVHCAAQVLNERRQVLATRLFRIQSGKWCFCLWRCICACIALRGVHCQPVTQSRYHVIGHRESLPIDMALEQESVFFVYDFWIKVAIFSSSMLFTMLFLGLLKGMLGILCCPSVGRWGLGMLADHRYQCHYYEKHLAHKKMVFDDEGFPVHPDTLSRSIRNHSRAMEFCLNLIFFLAFPFVILTALCRRCFVRRACRYCPESESKWNMDSGRSTSSKSYLSKSAEDTDDEDTKYVLAELRRSREYLRDNPVDENSPLLDSEDEMSTEKALSLVKRLHDVHVVYRNLNVPIGGVEMQCGVMYSIRGFFMETKQKYPKYKFLTSYPLKQYWDIEDGDLTELLPPRSLKGKEFEVVYENAEEVLLENELSELPRGFCINARIQPLRDDDD